MDQNQAETNYQLKYTVLKLVEKWVQEFCGICKSSAQAGGNE